MEDKDKDISKKEEVYGKYDEVYGNKDLFWIAVILFGTMLFSFLLASLIMSYLGEDEYENKEYNQYTQEVEIVDVSNRLVYLGNGAEVKVNEDDIKLLSVGDYITYKKAEGEDNIEEIKVVGNNNE